MSINAKRTLTGTVASKGKVDGKVSLGTVAYCDGTDGFSPIIEVEPIDGGNRIIITDAEGQKTVDILNGKDGDSGDSGRSLVIECDADGHLSPTFQEIWQHIDSGGSAMLRYYTDPHDRSFYTSMPVRTSGSISDPIYFHAAAEDLCYMIVELRLVDDDVQVSVYEGQYVTSESAHSSYDLTNPELFWHNDEIARATARENIGAASATDLNSVSSRASSAMNTANRAKSSAEAAELTAMQAKAKAESVEAALGDIDGGAAIIDVIELPTDEINESCFYRLLTATFIDGSALSTMHTCRIVSTLPDEGDPVTADMKSILAYYNTSDNTAYGYINGALHSATGVPVGWYPLDALAGPFGVDYGGVISSIRDALNFRSLYLLVRTSIYEYDGEWTENDHIGNHGTGLGAEVFNDVYNVASGNLSHAEGSLTTASGYCSHAEGSNTTASGHCSHAEGLGTNAGDDSSHAEGYNTTASGYCSHAEGDGTTASGYCSHAEGNGTTAIADSSHAEGSFTTASGLGSHAEGSNTTASGHGSHAEGNTTVAIGDYSHAEGYNTTASGYGSHVQGKYNVEDAAGTYAHIVGNGDAWYRRSNAHTLDWNGNAWFQGSVRIGGTSQVDAEAKELATVEYVNTLRPGISTANSNAQGAVETAQTALNNANNANASASSAYRSALEAAELANSAHSRIDALEAAFDELRAYAQAIVNGAAQTSTENT